MKNTVDKILAEHTEYSSVEDIDPFNTVEIESGSDAIMNLHIGRESETEVTVAQYVDGNARKPDPLVYFDLEDGELIPTHYRDTLAGYEVEKGSRELDVWKKNLRQQFL